MKIVVTGGGTAGHVTPLLAVVSKIADQCPQAQIKYIGQYNDKFADKLISADRHIAKHNKILAGKLRRFHGRGLGWYLAHPTLILRNIRDIFLVAIGLVQAVSLLIVWRPNVVFVKGGYVGLPVGIAAGLLRIPIVTHDSDAIPGLTNRIVAKFARKMAVALPAEAYKAFYPLEKVVETGVPVRSEYLDAISSLSVGSAKKSLGLAETDEVLTLVGGSLGAVRLNSAFLAALPQLVEARPSLKIIWATGASHYQEILGEVQSNPLLVGKLTVKPFFDDLASVFIASDLVISRSGATTLAELAITKTPTILVPNPVLTGGHQTVNANFFKRKNACIVVQEETTEENPQHFAEIIINTIGDINLRKDLSENIAKFAHPNAADKLAALILGVGK